MKKILIITALSFYFASTTIAQSVPLNVAQEESATITNVELIPHECQSGKGAATAGGAVIGGGLGAVAGRVVGGKGSNGTMIGTALGAGLGGLIGASSLTDCNTPRYTLLTANGETLIITGNENKKFIKGENVQYLHYTNGTADVKKTTN